MINATHIKVPYTAECIQLTETNALEVIEFLHREGYTAWQVSGFIYYSRPDQGTCGLPVTWWIRKGEDGVIKFLPDDLFQLKYRKIENHNADCTSHNYGYVSIKVDKYPGYVLTDDEVIKITENKDANR